jgi:hypothetical protein
MAFRSSHQSTATNKERLPKAERPLAKARGENGRPKVSVTAAA